MEEYSAEEGNVKKENYSEEENLEESFMKGYTDEEKIVECSECGGAINEKKLIKEVEGEHYTFCSEACAEEFEESVGSN